MPIAPVKEHGEIEEKWANLHDVSNGRILMSLSWLDTSIDRSIIEGLIILTTFMILKISIYNFF